jgi:hypothetical protein
LHGRRREADTLSEGLCRERGVGLNDPENGLVEPIERLAAHVFLAGVPQNAQIPHFAA